MGGGKKKKSSENDQLTGHFQSFFLLFLISPKIPRQNLKKNFFSMKQIIFRVGG